MEKETEIQKAPETSAPKAEKETPKEAGKLAVIKTGGKQYLVKEGQVIKIEKLSEGSVKEDKVTFDEVLMTIDGDKVTLGTPTLPVKVSAEIMEEGRNKKIAVIKYRAKSRHFVNKGHRQPFHRVRIAKIS